MKIPSTAYLWFDTEFTSLELDEAQLLQVSAMLTDRNLERLTPPEEDINFYVRLDESTPVSAWVEQHLASLLEKSRSDEAVPVDQLDEKLTEYVDRWCGTPVKTIKKRPLMAGNSVHNDWVLARKFCPGFVSRLNYRLLDVSTIKVQWLDLTEGGEFDKNDGELVQKYAPPADVSRLRQHDAYYDIIASAAELAYYRAHMSYSV